MLKYLTIFIVVLSTGGAANAQSALQVRDDCREIAQDARIMPNGKISIPTTFQAGFCWGAFAAFQGISTFTFDDAEESVMRLCIPPEATRKQLVEVFYDYALANPSMLHEDWTRIAYRSLDQAFPC